jgi:hypothetical protein
MSDTVISSVGTGLATFERIKTIFYIFIFIILFSLTVMFIIYAIQDKHTSSMNATITNAVCDKITGKDGNVEYTCAIDVTYKVGDQECNVAKLIAFNQTPYEKGQVVTISYDPSNVCDARYGIPLRTVAYMTIAILSIVTIFFGLNAYFVFKSKSYATGVGAVDIGRSIFIQ